MFSPNTGPGWAGVIAPAQRRAREARRRLSPASNPFPSPLGWALGLGQHSGQAGRRLSRCQDSEPPPGSPSPVPAHTPPPIKGGGPRVGSPQGVCASLQEGSGPLSWWVHGLCAQPGNRLLLSGACCCPGSLVPTLLSLEITWEARLCRSFSLALVG